MLALGLFDARQFELELRILDETGAPRDGERGARVAAVERNRKDALVGHVERGDGRRAADGEGAAADPDRKPRRIGERAAQGRGAADGQRVAATGESGDAVERRTDRPE